MHYSFLLIVLLLISCGQLELSDSLADNPPAADKSPASDTSVPDADNPSETISVPALPTPCSIWQNHIVALVAPVSEASASDCPEALITLISLYDWANLPSALNADNPTLATSIAQGYQEYDLTHWRIPTAAEAKALRAAYPAPAPGGLPSAPVPEESSSGITGINALLMQAEGLLLIPDARYLCEEGTKSFSFAPGTTISAAGTKSTNYRLRLVKTLRLKQKQ